MERMDRVRRYGGLGWVLAGLVFQFGWVLAGHPLPAAVTLVLVAVAAALTAATFAQKGRRVLGWVVAVALGLDFAGAVADRFGLLGAPGQAGVSWGTWGAFVQYTGRLLPGLPGWLVLASAVLATVLECALAVLLVTGWQRRWVGKATAGLLAVYLVAMTVSLGIGEAAAYAMPVLVGAALLVSATPVARTRDGGAHMVAR